jgi:hypothetical protein
LCEGREGVGVLGHCLAGDGGAGVATDLIVGIERA